MYRRRQAVRTEPLPGHASFFQEGLFRWRELCSAEDWLAAAAVLTPLSQTLPQLVHHSQEVAGVLLGAVRPDAALSLAPMFDLLAQLARDLQGEYLALLPAVMQR